MILVNTVLILGIIVFIYLANYKKTVIIDSSFNSEPVKLIEMIKDHFPGMEQKDWSLIFIYNQLPSNSNIADIEKLYSKLKNEISIAAFFNRRFNSKVPITFPYHSSDNFKLAYKKKQSIIEDNFYVILKKNRINYIKKGFDLFELSFLLQKRLYPDSGYKDYALSIDR